jgi:hypothetical protein
MAQIHGEVGVPILLVTKDGTIFPTLPMLLANPLPRSIRGQVLAVSFRICLASLKLAFVGYVPR